MEGMWGLLITHVVPTSISTLAVQIIVSCTKGILNDTLETPDAILKRILPARLHGRCASMPHARPCPACPWVVWGVLSQGCCCLCTYTAPSHP